MPTAGPLALRRRVLAAVGILLLAVTACGPASSTSIASQGLVRQPDGWRGLPIEADRSLPDVTLLRTDGQPVALAETFAGDPTLLFFGYTSCPDICPIHLATIASAMQATGTTFQDLDVVFVSVDPDRDDPRRIDDYLANFDRGITGLHGDLAAVEEALRRLDLPGPVVEGADPRGEGDLIGHPAQVIGFDADGRAQRVWPFGARRSDWVADLPRILEEWS